MADEKLIFPIGFDLEEGVSKVEKDWGKMQKRLQDTFKSQTIQVDADISKAVLDKLYAKFEGLIKTMESKAPQIKLKIPDTVDFEQEINRLKVQLKSINLGELTDAESKDLYLYIRQLEALAKALKEVNKQEQLRQANRPEVIALRQAQAEEKRTRAIANSALAEQRRAKIATETARQNEINNRSAQRGAVIAEQKRAATARAENAELRLTQAKKRSTQATHEQNTAYKTQSTYLSRLITRMAAYFSIHQAFNFLRQIREVTAEFELQRIALGALIQDANKANIIFEQIKVQAVKSPFEIKELVTYTKRLAAYGVEADELMGTMNRLADISAGLGADMNRIILAYGQIQAAGVLKGTELRQLTELGIPMVDLLAQYYSTLRNEVVTTSEVFDMISKKEIPFQAVKDILEDLTSEGGRFYEMQAVQAETLAGQWSNMKDTLSIMFDEMGRTEEVRGVLEGFIDSVEYLALNWKEVWSVVKALGFAYATLRGSAAIIRLLTIETIRQSSAKRDLILAERRYQAASFKTNGFLKIRLALERAQVYSTRQVALANNFATASMWKLVRATLVFIATNPIGLIMGIAGAFGIYKLATSDGIDAMDAFSKRQQEMVKESVKNTTILESNFKRLANEIVNSEEGSQRQIQALRRLKQQYGEIFPDWKLTVDYLQEIYAGASDTAKAFDNMAASIRAFATEDMRQTLIENYKRQLEEQFYDTFAKLTDAHGNNFAEAIGEITNRAFKEGVTQEALMDEVVDEFLRATGQSLDDFVRRLDIIDYNAGIGMSEAKEIFKGWDLSTMISQLQELGTTGQADALLLLLELAEAFRVSDDQIDQMLRSFDALDPRMRTVNQQLEDLKHNLNEIDSRTGQGSAEATENAVNSAREEAINEFLRQLLQDERLNWALPIPLNIDNLTEQLPNIEAQVEAVGRSLSDAFYTGLLEARELSGDYDDMWRENLADMRRYTDNGTRLIQAYSSDQIQAFEGLPQALDGVAKRYKELSEELKRQQAILASSAIETDETLRENTEQRIETINIILEMLYGFLNMYNALDLLETRNTRSTTRNPRIELLNNELSTVEKIYKEYQRLLKYMTDEEAREHIEEMFGNVEYSMLNTALSAEEMREQYERALQEARRMGDQKQILDIEYKIGSFNIEESRRSIERDIQRLADELSRTRSAREFFDRMLGLSGDRQLSATLTMSVYGTTGDELEGLMRQQIEQAFAALPEDYNLADAILEGGNYDYNKLASWIEHLPEEHRKAATQIVDNWRTSNARILEDLYKSYDDFLSFEQRKTLVVARETRERERIAESLFDEATKQSLTDASYRRQRRDIADIAVEEFKASEDWAKAFEDLANLSTPTIERLMTKLREFIDTQDDLSPEQLKTLTQEYDKLYDGLIARNPFRAIADGIEEYKEAMRDIATARENLALAELADDTASIEQAERALADAFDSAQAASTKLKNGIEVVGDKFSQASSDVEFFANALGFSEDSQATQFLMSMSNAFKGVSIAIGLADVAMKLFDGSTKSFFASNPIGWILLAVSAVVSAVQAIMNARINRVNKEIEALEDKLDSLKHAYDRLQKSAERAFGTEYIQNYERQLANLEAQVEAYEKQLELERSKGKKADEDKIKEYKNQIRDAKDAIKDMYGSLSEHFLGTDLTSAARDFASAWIDAYKSFSNTTDAMKEKFQEMIQNMIVESLIAKVMERALDPVFRMVENMGDSDFYSNSFWSQLMTEMNKATENGVVGAQNIMGMLESIGINLRDTGTGLTGISRDIATASEESILGLAAGINTQNFYISQVPTKLDTIIGLLRGGSAVVDSGVNVQDLITIQNQFLSHLPTIAQNTAETVARCERAAVACESMASKLGSVIKPKGTTSTHSVNVTIGS